MNWSLRLTGKNLGTKKENEQTHVEFAKQLFDRWCSSNKIGSDHEKLRQLMLVEEFKRCINSDIKSFLDEKQVETLEAAARLADDYALTHTVSFINKSNPSRINVKKIAFGNKEHTKD